MKIFYTTDEHKDERWPEEFLWRPVAGDYVESASGKRARIAAIIHKYGLHNMGMISPYVMIELCK